MGTSSSARRQLLLATTNADKAREFRTLLAGVPYTLVTPHDIGLQLHVAETGTTLGENAALKARAFANASGLPALADDSGLEVEALGGEPGVRTARYAGDDATPEQRNRYLLAKLDGVPPRKRRAAFRCVIAIAVPNTAAKLLEGKVEGVIAPEPKGELGWGYDPVFLLPGLDKTLAQLSPAMKNRYSHRGRAARKARRWLISHPNVGNDDKVC